jgi:hypothetical protein
MKTLRPLRGDGRWSESPEPLFSLVCASPKIETSAVGKEDIGSCGGCPVCGKDVVVMVNGRYMTHTDGETDATYCIGSGKASSL